MNIRTKTRCKLCKRLYWRKHDCKKRVSLTLEMVYERMLKRMYGVAIQQEQDRLLKGAMDKCLSEVKTMEKKK